jgi:hypothetical protein
VVDTKTGKPAGPAPKVIFQPPDEEFEVATAIMLLPGVRAGSPKAARLERLVNLLVPAAAIEARLAGVELVGATGEGVVEEAGNRHLPDLADRPPASRHKAAPGVPGGA